MKALFITLLLAMSVFAQVKDSSMVMVRKCDLPTNLVTKIETEQKFQTLGRYAGLGKEVGTSIREGLGALTEETNKFANTKVGYFVMFIIAFKVVGYAIIQLLIGVPLLFAGTLVFIWYFRNSHMKRRVIDTITGSGKDKVETYKTIEPEYFSYNVGAVAIYVLFVLMCMGIIFIH